MYVTFDRAEPLADDIQTLWFHPEQPISYLPGQYIELYLPHALADDRGRRRWFTLTTTPDDPEISITTRFPGKPSTYKQALRELQPGQQIAVSGPLGDFVLPKDSSIPLVFVAAGTGAATYASMVKWLHRHNEKRSIRLIYAARTPDDFIFTDLWQKYGLDYVPLASAPDDAWRGQTGQLTLERLLSLLGDIDRQLIYLAGPQSLVEPLYDGLQTSGIPRSQLLLDYFPGY